MVIDDVIFQVILTGGGCLPSSALFPGKVDGRNGVSRLLVSFIIASVIIYRDSYLWEAQGRRWSL